MNYLCLSNIVADTEVIISRSLALQQPCYHRICTLFTCQPVVAITGPMGRYKVAIKIKSTVRNGAFLLFISWENFTRIMISFPHAFTRLLIILNCIHHGIPARHLWLEDSWPAWLVVICGKLCVSREADCSLLFMSC